MNASVSVEHGRVATITLRRPERRNALDGAMLTALRSALSAIAEDPDCRCVLLQGEGDHFCAGADFAEITSGAEDGVRYGGVFEELLRAIEEHLLPVVAMVRGAALGAGAQILAACDLAVAAEDATIGIPSAKLGLLLDLEKIQRLVAVVGVGAAREMLLTGRPWSGTEAAARGLVTAAVPLSDLDAATGDVVEAVAGAAPLSVRGSKAAIRMILDHLALDRARNPREFALHDVRGLAALQSADLQEGLAASRERRRAQFRGA